MAAVVWLILLTASGVRGQSAVGSLPEAATVSASSAQLPIPELRPIAPADAPPPGHPGWLRIKRTEVEAFLRQLRLPKDAIPPPSVSVRKATYEATLTGTRLSGAVRLEMEAVTSSPAWLMLGDPSLYLANLKWPDREAVWGTADDQRSILLVQEEDRVLTGEWALAGERIFDRVEFEARIPVTAMTELVLHLPAGRRVLSPSGIVEGPAAGRRPGEATWRVHLGRRGHMQFQIVPEANPSTGRLYVREDLTATVHPEGMELLLDLDVWGQANPTLQMVLSDTVRLTSATTAGDAPLPVTLTPTEEGVRAELKLADVAASAVTRVRLRAFQPTLRGTSDLLPRPRVLNATVMSHQLTLHVQRPLVIEEIVPKGYRATDIAVDTTQSETWQFEATELQPELKLSTTLPASLPQGTVAAWADYSRTTPRLSARLTLNGGGAPCYSVRFRFPRGWDLLAVEPAFGDAPTVLSGFHSEPDSDPQYQVISIEFREALLSGQTRQLTLQAIGHNAEGSLDQPSPAMQPLDFQWSHGLFGLLAPADAELSLTNVVGATTPSDEERQQFESFVPDFTPDHALFVEWTAAQPLMHRSVLRFETVDATRITKTGDTTASPNFVSTRPAITELQLTTFLAAAGANTHLHDARYELAGPFSGEVKFRLPGTSILLAVAADGISVPVVVRGEWVHVTEPVTAAHSLSVRFRTSAAAGWLTQEESLQLPDWDGLRFPLKWNLVASSDRSSFRVDQPFLEVTHRDAVPLGVRFLGPLARVPSSGSTSRTVDVSDPGAAVEEPETVNSAAADSESSLTAQAGLGGAWLFGIREVEGIETPPQLVWSSWNTRSAWIAAWLALTGSLLAGVLFRRLLPWLLKWGAPLWMAFLCITTWFAADPYVPIAGAAILGSMGSLLLPRRIVHGRQSLLGEPERSHSGLSSSQASAAPLVATSILMLLIFGAGQSWSQEPTTPTIEGTSTPNVVLVPTVDGKAGDEVYLPAIWKEQYDAWSRRGTTAPQWLIRSATYRVAVAGANVTEAAFDVLTRDAARPLLIGLPLDNVLFASTSDATVDGIVTTIFPAATGQGVVVEIPAADESQPSTESAAWRVRKVVLRFRPQSEGSPRAGRISFQVPRVLSSLLHMEWTGPRPDQIEADSDGGPVAASSPTMFTAAVGPKSTILSTWQTGGATRTRDGFSGLTSGIAVTMMDLYPLRQECRTMIPLPQPGSEGSGTLVQIELPARAWIRSVIAPENSRWTSVIDETGVHLQLEVPSKREPSQTIDIQYLLPWSADPGTGDAGHPTERRLTLPIRVAGLTQDLVGLRSAPGYLLLVSDEAAGRPVPPEELLAAATIPNLVPPEIALRMADNESVSIQLVPREPRKRAVIEQILEIGRTHADWTATVRLTVDQASSPRHWLRIDPRLEITNVSVEQDGAQRLHRRRLTDDRLELVLTRPLSGVQQILIEGRLPVDSGQLTAMPAFSITDAEIESSARVVSNHSGWKVELTDAEGRPLPAPRSEIPDGVALALGSAMEPGAVGSFRLIPGPDSVTYDTITTLHPDEANGWQVRIFVNVRPVDAPLGEIAVLIPPAIATDCTLVPRRDVLNVVEQPDGSKRVTLHPGRFRGAEYRFRVQGPLTLPETDVWETTDLRIESAQRDRSLLLLDERFPYRPTSSCSEETSLDAIPPLYRPFNPPEEQHAFAMTREAWTWIPFNEVRASSHVVLLQSAISLDPPQAVHGRTDLICVTSGPARIALILPEDVTPRQAQCRGRPIEIVQTPEGVELSLPDDLAGEAVSLWWSGPLPDGVIHVPQLAGTDETDAEDGPQHLVLPARDIERHERLAGISSPVALMAAQMNGLLEAVELQSTRTFDLNNPLLSRLRRLNSRLELASSRTPEGATREEIAALQDRWQRLQQLISVNSPPPGSAGSAASGTVQLHSSFEAAPLEGVLLLPGQSQVRVERRWLSRTDLRFLLFAIIAGFAMWWLIVRGIAERGADWLALRPGATCLLVGSVWTLFLNPWPVGPMLILAGAILLALRLRSHRRRQSLTVASGGS